MPQDRCPPILYGGTLWAKAHGLVPRLRPRLDACDEGARWPLRPPLMLLRAADTLQLPDGDTRASCPYVARRCLFPVVLAATVVKLGGLLLVADSRGGAKVRQQAVSQVQSPGVSFVWQRGDDGLPAADEVRAGLSHTAETPIDVARVSPVPTSPCPVSRPLVVRRPL